MTPQQIKKAFHQEGKTITDWAREYGFNRNHVYQVLSGRCKGLYGKGYKIAVKLGIHSTHTTH